MDNLARAIVTKLGEKVGVPADADRFGWFAHSSDLPEQIEAYRKDWIGPLRCNRQVTDTGDQIRVDALEECIDTTERHIEDDTTSGRRNFPPPNWET